MQGTFSDPAELSLLSFDMKVTGVLRFLIRSVGLGFFVGVLYLWGLGAGIDKFIRKTVRSLRQKSAK